MAYDILPGDIPNALRGSFSRFDNWSHFLIVSSILLKINPQWIFWHKPPQGNYFLSKLTTKSGKTLNGSVTHCTQEDCLLYFTGLFMTSSGEVWKSLQLLIRWGIFLILFNIYSLTILFCKIVNEIHFSIHYNDIFIFILGIFTALYLFYLGLLWNQWNLFFHRYRKKILLFRKKYFACVCVIFILYIL